MQGFRRNQDSTKSMQLLSLLLAILCLYSVGHIFQILGALCCAVLRSVRMEMTTSTVAGAYGAKRPWGSQFCHHQDAVKPLIKPIEFSKSHRDLLDSAMLMLKNGKSVCLVTRKHRTRGSTGIWRQKTLRRKFSTNSSRSSRDALEMPCNEIKCWVNGQNWKVFKMADEAASSCTRDKSLWVFFRSRIQYYTLTT